MTPPILITSHEVASQYLPTPAGRTLSGIVSIGDFRSGPPTGFAKHAAPKLRLEFDDVDLESHPAGYAGATIKDVRNLIRFGTDDPSPFGETPVLVHCGAGISRSSACALVLLYLRLNSEEAAVTALLESVRYAEAMRLRVPGQEILPNRRVLFLADQELGSSLLNEVSHRFDYQRDWGQ